MNDRFSPVQDGRPSTMKITILFVLALVLFVTSGAEAMKRVQMPKRRRCYTESARYCWEYKSCGVLRKRKHHKYPCKLRVCRNKCSRKCRVVMKKKVTRRCIKHGKYAKCKFGWLKVPMKRCPEHCYKHCYHKRYMCSVTKVFAYPKLCVFKKRIYRKRHGHVKKPAQVILLQRKLVRTIRKKAK